MKTNDFKARIAALMHGESDDEAAALKVKPAKHLWLVRTPNDHGYNPPNQKPTKRRARKI